MTKYFYCNVIQDDKGNFFIAYSLIPVWGELVKVGCPVSLKDLSTTLSMSEDRCRIALMNLIALGLVVKHKPIDSKSKLYSLTNYNESKIAFEFYESSSLPSKKYKLSKQLPYLRLFDCVTPKPVFNALKGAKLPNVSSYLLQYDLYEVYDTARGVAATLSVKGKQVLADFEAFQQLVKKAITH